MGGSAVYNGVAIDISTVQCHEVERACDDAGRAVVRHNLQVAGTLSLDGTTAADVRERLVRPNRAVRVKLDSGLRLRGPANGPGGPNVMYCQVNPLGGGTYATVEWGACVTQWERGAA